MKIYIDTDNKIKSVDKPVEGLTEVEVDDDLFKGWSEAKICCYSVYTSRVRVTPYPEPTIEIIDGNEIEVVSEDLPEEEIEYKLIVTGYYPNTDSRLLWHIDQLGKATEAVTPYTETKTAYIGDTEVTFSNRPGNLTVYFPHPYTVERLTDRIIVSFDELEEVTDITISIL